MKITKSQLKQIIKEELDEAKRSREERRAVRQKIQAKAVELAGVKTNKEFHAFARQEAEKEGVTPAEIYRKYTNDATKALQGQLSGGDMVGIQAKTDQGIAAWKVGKEQASGDGGAEWAQGIKKAISDAQEAGEKWGAFVRDDDGLQLVRNPTPEQRRALAALLAGIRGDPSPEPQTGARWYTDKSQQPAAKSKKKGVLSRAAGALRGMFKEEKLMEMILEEYMEALREQANK